MPAVLSIPNDWPTDLSVPVISPVTYLRAQAEKLTELTNGVVRGDVFTTTNGGPEVSHSLAVVCPGLGGYREHLVIAYHREQREYPVRVESPEFEFHPDYDGDPEEFEWPLAENYDRFRELVRKVLNSPNTVSLIQSLLARSNDAKLAAS